MTASSNKIYLDILATLHLDQKDWMDGMIWYWTVQVLVGQGIGRETLPVGDLDMIGEEQDN